MRELEIKECWIYNTKEGYNLTDRTGTKTLIFESVADRQKWIDGFYNATQIRLIVYCNNPILKGVK